MMLDYRIELARGGDIQALRSLLVDFGRWSRAQAYCKGWGYPRTPETACIDDESAAVVDRAVGVLKRSKRRNAWRGLCDVVLGRQVRGSEGHGAGVADGPRGAAREDLIRLQGRNFVLISETDNGATFREGAVKAMTGGDKIVARAPYSRSSLEFYPVFVPFMQTNNLPHIPTAGNAAWARRLTPIACNNNIMKMFKPDPAIDDVLKAEAAGIFNLILEHALIVLAKGLTIPESVRKAREDYRNSEDLLGEFIDDCVEVMPESESAVLEEYTVSKSALYIAFSNYANNAGEGDSIKSRKQVVL